MTVRAVVRTDTGSVTVQETTNLQKSPVLAVRASAKLGYREARELRDVLDEWLRERGRGW